MFLKGLNNALNCANISKKHAQNQQITRFNVDVVVCCYPPSGVYMSHLKTVGSSCKSNIHQSMHGLNWRLYKSEMSKTRNWQGNKSISMFILGKKKSLCDILWHICNDLWWHTLRTFANAYRLKNLRSGFEVIIYPL